jgi:hypothetical protein
MGFTPFRVERPSHQFHAPSLYKQKAATVLQADGGCLPPSALRKRCRGVAMSRLTKIDRRHPDYPSAELRPLASCCPRGPREPPGRRRHPARLPGARLFPARQADRGPRKAHTDSISVCRIFPYAPLDVPTGSVRGSHACRPRPKCLRAQRPGSLARDLAGRGLPVSPERSRVHGRCYWRKQPRATARIPKPAASRLAACRTIGLPLPNML